MYLAYGSLDKGMIAIDKLTAATSALLAKKWNILAKGQIKAIMVGANNLELYGLDKDELLASFGKWRAA